MSALLTISHAPRSLMGEVLLPASKSEVNRLLMLQALSRGLVRPGRLSSAEDSVTLARLLRSDAEILDVGHAGTAMRFLTAYLAFQPRDVVLTGSGRMQQRPIGLLVDALRTMGAEIACLGEEGFPPLMIFGRNARFGSSEVRIRGDVSSQYLSALLMLAPTLPDGLVLHIEGELISAPYLRMTLALMAQAGIHHEWEGGRISVPAQPFRAAEIMPGMDWSAASYWYVALALSEQGELRLPGLRADSPQGDRAIAELMRPLGVETEFDAEGAVLRRVDPALPERLELDLVATPDLAQSLVVCCAALGLQAEFTGLESLRIKETDRIAALDQELRQFGYRLEEQSAGRWTLHGTFRPVAGQVRTYEDHRMAMAFAPLALKVPQLKIEAPEVVGKSYPEFWEVMAELGFHLSPE